MAGIDNDLEIVIQFLADVAAEFSGEDALRMGVEAGNAEVDFALAVEDANFRLLRRRAPFKGLALPKVGNWSCLEPEWII